jgi:glycerol transport system ATP-binding protein
MKLTLAGVGKRVGADTHLYPFDLEVVPGTVTVLLGATLSGKTSLMRVMAGLDRPTQGRVLVDDVDVTQRSVRERAVSMVYQQFINYPSLTVFENIASPLRLKRAPGVDARVRELAQRLHIEHLLDRFPSQLSGGQQQRVALARALAKGAPLMLLDEPLVNLDYKLREELREELSQLFADGSATVIYATTEPSEALMMGGHTAVLDRGRLLQYGPTPEVFRRPCSIEVARAFSDPPMNLVTARRREDAIELAPGLRMPADFADLGSQAELRIGVRANHLRVDGVGSGLRIPARVQLAEISGSDTFVHVSTQIGNLVAQLTGVHRIELGRELELEVAYDNVYVFDAAGKLLHAPAGTAGTQGAR